MRVPFLETPLRKAFDTADALSVEKCKELRNIYKQNREQPSPQLFSAAYHPEEALTKLQART